MVQASAASGAGSNDGKQRRNGRRMARLSFFVLILLLGGLAAGGVFLMTWDIPAPTHNVEKVIPNERFQP